jgi:hypothetical protein
MIPIRVSASKGCMAGKIPGLHGEKAASPSMKRHFYL